MLAVAACDKAKTEAPKKQDATITLAAPSDAAAAEVAVDARAKQLYVTGAVRCGECHEKMFEEWKTSLHARAQTSPLFLAARKDAGNAQCGNRCHAPLVAQLGEDDRVAQEGITCDVCHTMRDMKPSAKGGEFRLAIDDMVKFGPRCDLEDHYFHRMGCSKEHATAQVCGTCHWWERNGIPVFTEYKEFLETDDAKKGTVCQDCHMPGEKAPLAEGSPVRTDVRHHGLLGISQDLRRRALAIEVKASASADGMVIDVGVTNTTAAHYVPSGLPERRIIVRATVGAATHDWTFGRVLVDDKGAPAPFWRAAKVAEDTRIAPGATAKGTWTTTEKGPVKIEAIYVPFALPLDGVLETTETLATFEVATTRLPVTKLYTPPSPGKRKKAP